MLHVLAVDDHSINRAILEAGLGARLASLTLAETGDEAVRLCRDREYDLVLMDLHLPDMDGMIAWQRIRDVAGSGVCARGIALTADCHPGQRDRLVRAGFDEVLIKPVATAALLRAIHRSCNGAGTGSACSRDGVDPFRLIDRDRALAAANGDHAMVRHIGDMLAEELDSRMGILDDLLDRGRFAEAVAMLHQWTGACGYAGATGLEQACRAFHHSLQHCPERALGLPYVRLLNVACATRAALREPRSEVR